MRNRRGKTDATTTWPLTPPFRRDGVVGWVADLPADLQPLADTNEQPYGSRLRLFEGELLLGPAHSVHATIRTSGRGAYSFWDNVLYFSTPDGTDPNVNGRDYRAVLPPLRAQPKNPEATVEPTWTAPTRLVRCALFGLGNRGVGLGTLAQSLPGVEIAWVVDQSRERLAEVPKLFGTGVKVSTEIAEPLADANVDVALVVVPDHLH